MSNARECHKQKTPRCPKVQHCVLYMYLKICLRYDTNCDTYRFS